MHALALCIINTLFGTFFQPMYSITNTLFGSILCITNIWETMGLAIKGIFHTSISMGKDTIALQTFSTSVPLFVEGIFVNK